MEQMYVRVFYFQRITKWGRTEVWGVREEEDDKNLFQVAGMSSEPRKADEEGSIDDFPRFYVHIPKTRMFHKTA
jgi:hypothetical protein